MYSFQYLYDYILNDSVCANELFVTSFYTVLVYYGYTSANIVEWKLY